MPSPTEAELKVMKNRREAARSAIKFLSKSVLGIQTYTGIKTVRSANNPFDGLTKAQKNDFYKNRNNYMGRKVTYDKYKYVDTLDYKSDPDFLGYVYGKDLYDELQTTKPDAVLMLDVAYQFEDSLLGSVSQTMRTGMGNTPNPRQLVVRHNVMKNPTRSYNAPKDGVGTGQEVGVKRFF